MSSLSIHSSPPDDPCPEHFNMARYAVADPARRWPGKPALIVVDGAAPDEMRATWLFSEIDIAVRCAAGALLSKGLRPGERVLIRVGDTPTFPIAYFGAIAAGGVAMPLSSQLSPEELNYIAADAQPRFAVLDEACPAFDMAGATRLSSDDLTSDEADYRAMHRDDPAQLVYTSGTSGKPKGVLHAQRSVWARRMMRAGWHDMRETDRVMHTGAFNWTYVLGCGLSDPWSVGATAILNAGDRSPQVWSKLAARWQPTIFASVPGLYRRMLKYGADLDAGFNSLRHGLTAGEALPSSVRDGWLAATGKPLHEALGMSEVSTFVSSAPNRPADGTVMGWPQPGRHVAVIGDTGEPVALGEEGVLAVHENDPGLMLGYWRNEAETRRAYAGEWFLTGDRVAMRGDGALTFGGRNDDLMNAQGYRVAPQEVEAALGAHPSVVDCAVTELPIEDGLSIIGAWVVASDGISAEDLATHCRAHLAAYKVPRSFYRIDLLPRTANGKLQRRALPNAGAKAL